MVLYILIVAVFNLALGFAIAFRLGRRYRDLVVRVAGFSDFFVALSKDMQDEIIARTEYGL